MYCIVLSKSHIFVIPITWFWIVFYKMKKKNLYIVKWFAAISVLLLPLIAISVEAEECQVDTVKQETKTEEVIAQPTQSKVVKPQAEQVRKTEGPQKKNAKKTHKGHSDVLNRGLVLHKNSMINI